MNTEVMFSKQSDEWETPSELFEALDLEFDFALDVAANAHNAKCNAWMTDALNNDWPPVTCWMNPPYSQCREFIAKASQESKRGATIVCLVPSRTDTRWWHDYVWDREYHCPRHGVEIRFLKGRLRFGGAKAGAPFPSVIIVFRPEAA